MRKFQVAKVGMKVGSQYGHPLSLQQLHDIKRCLDERVDSILPCLGEFGELTEIENRKFDVKLSRVSHEVVDVFIEEETLFAEVEFRESPGSVAMLEYVIKEEKVPPLIARLIAMETPGELVISDCITLDFII